MKVKLLLCLPCLLFASAVITSADNLVIGTPSNSYTLPPTTKPSPALGTVFINFDSLSSGATYSTYTDPSGVTISSPDGLEVIPYSTQSAPNELFDTSSDGSANISIKTPTGVSGIGVGIADSDITAGGSPVSIFLQALNSSGMGFGTIFSVTLPETGSNPGNGYFVVDDTSADIYGLKITQPNGSADYSGLAIDDVALTPEPATYILLLMGIVILAVSRKRLA